ncbi:hypothetical protein [Actinoplanes sp. NBRC 103695]|uniref:hypothetical protein n=1 Tax=Actinoplanes sp. NBRC 103695 TaxID=3032202 RepID=UPI0024A2027A|nr:hypothetical protein [Actinoplanes sp. NBRC 103695]GLY94046.1 hypothetical protein Acsp02_13020 [Actinoplanes sp. NBRC 103695]
MQVRTRILWAMGAVVAVLAAQAVNSAPAAAATLPFGTVRAFVTQSVPDLRPEKPHSTPCPAGERVLGGGAFTVGGIHAVITEMQPIHPATGPDRFQVTAAADQFGIAGVWSIQVFAFCGVVPASAQLEIQQLTNPSTSAPVSQAGTRCSPGKLVVGTGGKIDNGGGQVDLGTVPGSSGGATATSAALAKEDADGFAGQYTLTGYSVCALPNHPLDFEMVRQTFRSAGAVPSQTAVIACPSGMALTGLAGATVRAGTHLQQIRPTVAGGRPANLASFGAQSAPTPDTAWDMDATVFCAR